MTGQPDTIGRYQIRERLGAGGFATVYRAHDPLLDIERALKVLHPHLASDPAIRDRFIREGRALVRIHHPNLVQVHDAGESDGAVYLAMELIEGVSLDAILDQRGALPIVEVAGIVEQTARALAAVHAHNLVHRDVKPDNILIEAGSNRVVLLDLGVARDLATATAGTWIVGTPSFMAPEQVQHDGTVSVRTDVYQLGATVYMLLSGRRPFDGDTLQVLDAVRAAPPPDLASLRPDLPPAVIATVAQAMAKDPGLRPATTPEFATQLRAAAGLTSDMVAPTATTLRRASEAPTGSAIPGRPLFAGPTAVPTAPHAGDHSVTALPPRRGMRAGWVAAVATIAVVAAVAAVVLLWPRDDSDAADRTAMPVTRNGQAALPSTAGATDAPSPAATGARAAPAAAIPSVSAAPPRQSATAPTSVPPSPPPSPTAAGGGQAGSIIVIKPYGAAVRISPSSDARIAISVGCGTTLRVLSASAGWYRVALDAPQAIAAGVLEGWVGQLRVADAATAARPDCAGAVLFRVNDPVTTSVQTGCLSLRETPSRSATILRCVENGTRYAIVNGPVEVDGEDWFELSDPRIGRGWSLAQFLLAAR